MSADAPRGEFVDTNILSTPSTAARGRSIVAAELVTRLWMERRGWISLQVMQEFYVSTTRKLKLPADQATLQVRRLRLWRCTVLWWKTSWRPSSCISATRSLSGTG